MKSLKKTLVLLVVFAMILSTVMPAFAASTDTYGLDCEEEVARLQALKVVTGYEDGSFKPENTITRAEMAVILCKMVGIDEVTCNENKSVPSKFSDVAVNEWYTGYINVAAGKGFLSGFPDGTFRPNDQLTMNQVLTLCVNALGRGEYVATMGAWPANYITEATKLGLLDGVKTSDANRGNVAIIVWNTLEVPAVWDVDQTVYEGDINLGNSGRSLLSIYFRDYVFTEINGRNNAILGYPLKEVEFMTVSQVPATDGELGEYQIRLTPEDEYADGFIEAFDTRAPRNKDVKEWTTADRQTDVITAYAPDFEDLDSYYGKIVTVIFGKDNVVVSIRVIDETVDDETLTAFEDGKLTIGGQKYKFADDAHVYVNTVEMTDPDTAEEAMTAIEGVLGIEFDSKYNKVIKSNIILNNNGKVSRLDLFVSGDYERFLTKEAIVEKVRNEVITLSNHEEIDYGEDVAEDDLPRFIKDGKIIKAADVEVGDVLTYYYKDNADKTVTTVYVSSKRVEGELTRASKTDLKLTVDGKAYYSSNNKLRVTTDKIKDAEDKTAAGADSYIGEDVELYVNIYGEYVLLSTENEAENWIFGIVTDVRDLEDDEEDDDLYYIPVRILLADGTTSREYKFIYDNEEDDGTKDEWEDDVVALKNKFVVFSDNGKKEIEYFDAYVVNADLANNTNGDYEATEVAANVNVDDDRQRIDGKIFSDDTVIFNTGNNGAEKASVSKDWKILITAADKTAQKAVLVYEKDKKTLAYVGIDVEDYVTSDAKYAIVVRDDYKEKSGSTVKKYVDLLTEDGEETLEAKSTNNNYLVDKEDYFVEYTLKGSKLNAAAALIDLPAFKKLKASAEVGTEIAESAETKLAVALFAAGEGAAAEVPAHYEACAENAEGALLVVAENANPDNNEVNLADVAGDIPTAEAGNHVKLIPAVPANPGSEKGTIKANFRVIATQKLLLEYEDDEDDVEVSLGEVEVDEDAIVFDARGGKLSTMTFNELRDEIEEGELYVIPYANGDAATDTANILVIVD